MVTYSYGKQLLAPGMRIGYLTVPPTMPDREAFRDAVFVAQLATGYAFPNALLQHAIEDLERIIIDIPAMQRRRDRLVGALRDVGYETTMPEGTFYVMARAPIADDGAFCDLLAKHRVLVLPGGTFEVPGWFRISLTATDEMVEPPGAGFDVADPPLTGPIARMSRRAVLRRRRGQGGAAGGTARGVKAARRAGSLVGIDAAPAMRPKD